MNHLNTIYLNTIWHMEDLLVGWLVGWQVGCHQIATDYEILNIENQWNKYKRNRKSKNKKLKKKRKLGRKKGKREKGGEMAVWRNTDTHRGSNWLLTTVTETVKGQKWKFATPRRSHVQADCRTPNWWLAGHRPKPETCNLTLSLYYCSS